MPGPARVRKGNYSFVRGRGVEGGREKKRERQREMSVRENVIGEKEKKEERW